MANAELRKLYINALSQYTGTLTNFIQVMQKMISNSLFTTTLCHLKSRATISFKNEGHSTDTTLSKYIWEVKKKLKIMLSLKWSIIKSVPT